MRMCKVLDREINRSSSGLGQNTVTLLLVCGHQLVRGGLGRGGNTAFQNAKHQRQAKCKECSSLED